MSHEQGAPRYAGRKHYHHGRTPAAWVGSIIAAIGFIVAAVGFMLPGINWAVIWIGFGAVAVGVILGGVLVKMGYGQG